MAKLEGVILLTSWYCDSFPKNLIRYLEKKIKYMRKLSYNMGFTYLLTRTLGSLKLILSYQIGPQSQKIDLCASK